MRTSFLRGVQLLILFTFAAASAMAAVHEDPLRHAALLKHPSVEMHRSAGTLVPSATSTQLGAFVPDTLLIARVDGASQPSGLMSEMAPAVFFGESVMSPAESLEPAPVRYGLGLSKPDRWTSVVTTLALCAFFVLRRMV